MSAYRTPRDPGGFPFGYNWRATITGLASLVIFNFAASQYIASRFHYQSALGRPLLRTRISAIYQPFAWCFWGFRNATSRDPRIRRPLFEGEMIVLGGSMLSMFVFFVAANRRARRFPKMPKISTDRRDGRNQRILMQPGCCRPKLAFMSVAGTARLDADFSICGTTGRSTFLRSLRPGLEKASAWSFPRCFPGKRVRSSTTSKARTTQRRRDFAPSMATLL